MLRRPPCFYLLNPKTPPKCRRCCLSPPRLLLLALLLQSCRRRAAVSLLLWKLQQNVGDMSMVAGGCENLCAVFLNVMRAPRLRWTTPRHT